MKKIYLLLFVALSFVNMSCKSKVTEKIYYGITINGELLNFTEEVAVAGGTVKGSRELNPVVRWDGKKGFFMQGESEYPLGYEKWAGYFSEGRNITLSPFIISKYEVTQELYEKVMGVNPSECVDSNPNYKLPENELNKYRPVDSVNWYEATLFCNELTKIVFGENTTELVYYEDKDFTLPYTELSEKCYMNPDKKGYRLPTATEWEYAARGGKKAIKAGTFADFYAGAALSENGLKDTLHPIQLVNSEADEIGWYVFNLADGTTKLNEVNNPCNINSVGWGSRQVGGKKPNELGIYDMSGNVTEWCYDWWSDRFEEGNFTDPRGPEDPVMGKLTEADSETLMDVKVYKGGDWNFMNTAVLTVTRACLWEPDDMEYPKSMGFRICRNAE